MMARSPHRRQSLLPTHQPKTCPFKPMEQEIEQLKEENKELQDIIDDLESDISDMRDALDEIYRIAKRF